MSSYHDLDALVRNNIISYVSIADMVKDKPTMSFIEIRHEIEKRKQYLSCNHVRYLWYDINYALVKYTIVCNEYITAIDIIGTDHRWDESMGYSKHPWYTTDYNVNGKEGCILGYNIRECDRKTCPNNGDGIYYLAHSPIDKYMNIVYPGYENLTIKENEIINMIQHNTHQHLIPCNKIVYPDGIFISDLLLEGTDVDLFNNLSFSLNILAKMGYWNYGTKHMLNIDYRYNNEMRNDLLQMKHNIESGSFQVITDYHTVIDISADGCMSHLTIAGRHATISKDMQHVYYDGREVNIDAYVLEALVDTIDYYTGIGISSKPILQ